MSAPIVTFLSDYGLDDDFVGVCHGVIATICPEARVIDITHGVERHDVRAGAVIMAGALPYMPVGVHLAVVDPDVGAERRAVAVRLGDGRTLVGPDNGLLWPSVEAGGGAIEAVEIATSPFRLEPVSATFHGRDIFAPVAARLAAGVTLAEVGVPLDPDELVGLSLPAPEVRDGTLVAHVVHVDRFGNVQLDAGHPDLATLGLRLGRRVAIGSRKAPFVRTFAETGGGELLVYEDSDRLLALAVNGGDAAAELGLSVGDSVQIIPL
jgi:S-adenosyl-L-methionine hydrolase (adenosine-forming)